VEREEKSGELNMCDVQKLKIHKRCKTPDEVCVIFVQLPKEKVGICRVCWDKIAEKDWEVGDSPKLTMEDILSDKVRLGDNPVETEYKYRGVKEDEEPNKEEEIE
jgi:hypothetical protein